MKSKHAGHIRPRGSKWVAVVYGRGDDGRMRHKWHTCATKKDAQNKLTDELKRLRQGGTIATTKETVGEFFTRWLKDYAARNVEPTTYASYVDPIKKHLRPALGPIRLSALTAPMIQKYIVDKQQAINPRNQQPYSSTTISAHVRLLHSILSYAVLHGDMEYNPCNREKLHVPARRRPKYVIWTPEQMRTFLATAKTRQSPYLPLYLTLLATGLRIGEALGLRWKDADLTTGRLTVNQTFARLGKQQLYKEPKTDKSRRTITLPADVRDALLDVREAQNDHRRLFGESYEDHDLIFCQANGRPLHAHNVARRDFRRVCAAAEVPRPRTHDLRHSSASFLLSQGVPLPVVSERLGHSRQSTTLDIYSHVLPGSQDAAAVVMGQIMTPKKPRVSRSFANRQAGGSADTVTAADRQGNQ
jgi:integrase